MKSIWEKILNGRKACDLGSNHINDRKNQRLF
jgi:hypothetical protein